MTTSRYKFKQLAVLAVILMFIAVSFLSLRQTSANSVNISQGYKASQPITAGSLVSLNEASNEVGPANSANVSNLLGVAINQSAANINFTEAPDTVQVGISGTYDIWVSDINGLIKSGDEVTASAVNGFGMRAGSPAEVIGVARATLTSKSAQATDKTIKVGKQNLKLLIGQIPVSINVGYWPGTTPPYTGALAPIQNFLSKIANKQISQTKAFICVVIFGLSLIVAAIILITVLVASLHSVARNPMARKAITLHLLMMILLVMVIVAAGVGAAFIAILA